MLLLRSPVRLSNNSRLKLLLLRLPSESSGANNWRARASYQDQTTTTQLPTDHESSRNETENKTRPGEKRNRGKCVKRGALLQRNDSRSHIPNIPITLPSFHTANRVMLKAIPSRHRTGTICCLCTLHGTCFWLGWTFLSQLKGIILILLFVLSYLLTLKVNLENFSWITWNSWIYFMLRCFYL